VSQRSPVIAPGYCYRYGSAAGPLRYERVREHADEGSPPARLTFSAEQGAALVRDGLADRTGLVTALFLCAQTAGIGAAEALDVLAERFHRRRP
jgi:hypothetical protein